MKRSLNQREKRLLVLCLSTVFIVINVLVIREFSIRRKALTSSLTQLEDKRNSNKALIQSRDLWEKRLAWLEKKMPFTDSAGRSQGQLLEDLQTAALDNELKITSQTLLEPAELDHGNEVAVNVRIRGDQDKLMRWLLTIQSPERFLAVKHLDLQLDARTPSKIPQAECNLIIAQWFTSTPPPGGVPAAPNPELTEPLVSPLETPSGVETALAPEKI